MLAAMSAAAPRSGSPSASVGRQRAPASRPPRAGVGAAAAGGRRRGSRAGRGDRRALGPVVAEELAPALADRRGVGHVLLVHLVDEPGVGPDLIGGGVVSHERSWYRQSGSSPEASARAGRVGRVRIATWNVNSLNARLSRVEEWVAQVQPDVLCMQETKLADDAFPALAFQALGYESAHHGSGRWNGVAILSRVGITDVVDGFAADGDEPDPDARLLWATCGDVRVASAYVPNGRALTDDHYQYKLSWLARLRALLDAPRRRRIAARRVRRLQHRPRRPRRVGSGRLRGRDPRERTGARGVATPRGLGPGRRLPPALRRARAVLVVGLPGRQLPQGQGHAHRPRAGRRRPWPSVPPARSSIATPARASSRATTRR